MLIKKFIIFVTVTLTVNSVFAQTNQWRVIWNQNPENNIDFYEVYRGLGPSIGEMAVIDSVYYPDTVFVDTSTSLIQSGQNIYYRIIAVNDTGVSSLPSDEAFEAVPKINPTFINFTLFTSDTISFNLNQSQYISDEDDDISLLMWDVQDLMPGDSIQHSMLNTSTIQFITPTDSTNQDLLLFKVFDPDSFYDEKSVTITLTKAITYFSPAVSGIPDQTIEQDSSFATFDLDNYVTDQDNNPNELTWTTSGENNLTVNINASTHVVTITANDTSWVGSETITFTATDPSLLFDEDVAIFKIIAAPNVSGIPNQTIEQDSSFSTFDLDNFVTDLDNSPNDLTWSTSGENNLTVNINANSHVVTITPNDTSWVGSEAITFRATDPDNLWGEDVAVFAINLPGNNVPEFTSEPDESAIAGKLYLYLVTAFDQDGDSLTFSLINGTPSFLNVVRNDSTSENSAFISGTPSLGSDDTYEVVILVSDNKGGTAEQRYNLIVTSSPLEQVDEIIAYPTPYIQSKSLVNYITFSSAPINSQLILYNLIGEPVFNTKVDNQPYTWYIKNNAGLDVQSGIYFYYVKEGSKILSSGKIVIIR